MTDSKSEQTVVEEIVSKLDGAPVECDGFVRLVSTALTAKEIDHTVFVGSLESPEGVIPLHFWIEWCGRIIDCRARMWLGSEAPHGIFEANPKWSYKGREADIKPFPSSIFFVLANIDLDSVVEN